MIDVTGVMVLSPVTSSSVKHLLLLDTNMVYRHGGGGATETLPDGLS